MPRRTPTAPPGSSTRWLTCSTSSTDEIVRDAPPQLTERFLAAFALAAERHPGRRLGTEIPYMAHLLVVTGLVLEDGGGENEAIGAVLHDSVEDGGGRPLLDRIQREFGERVAVIVAACSDTIDVDDPRPRSEEHTSELQSLRHLACRL